MSFCDAAIIILAHNGEFYTRKALESILTAETKPAEIFLIDNASTDPTPALTTEFQPKFKQAGIRWTTWRNSENKGCSLARNEAWAKVTSKYTVFMDNDVAVCTSNWLQLFLKIMNKNEKCGILGAKMLYPQPKHLIQCAGVLIHPNGRIAFRGRGKNRFDPKYQKYWPTWALISACWFMRTDLRETVGYLDETFHPVQYEDLDLCIRAKLKGYEVAYTPTVEMYHFEGGTTAAVTSIEYQTNIARNSLKFRERYHRLFKTFSSDIPLEEFTWKDKKDFNLGEELDLRLTE
ncbi:MAG: glycosyltransferase [Lentisphaeria bacterium]